MQRRAKAEGDGVMSHPDWRLKRSVVLVGMMGSGKTAVGKAIAGRLGVRFVDSDAAIEDAAQATIAEIFARDGEVFFRDREAEVIARLLSAEPMVMSTGGGAFMAQRNRVTIAERGVSLWLDVPLGVLWDRVRHKDTRPLLKTADPQGMLASLYAERTPLYALADMRLEVREGASVEETAAGVIDALMARSDVMERRE
jgi:shikimate kinase